MDSRFNLIDEPWIPVTEVGLASLRQIFSCPEYRTLGGNPVEKIALTKLLLAIAQAAATPKNQAQWEALGADGLAAACLAYLEQWHDRFWLYGEQPFLQMPAIEPAKVQPFGAVLPAVATGNTTVLSQSQCPYGLDEADQALLLVCLMAFALGGKKTDNAVVLTEGYAGKRNAKGRPSTGSPGPALGYLGFLHTLLMGPSLWSTLWINVLTSEAVAQIGIFSGGVGTPPWERMPQGEDCATARALRTSLMGRLVPLSRFCLLDGDGLHYSEGLAHDDYKAGIADTTTAINYATKAPKALWTNPERRPWRELTSLLAYIGASGGKDWQCAQLQACLARARLATPTFAIWSGGLRVSGNAGEQYVSGSDDYVESLVWLDSTVLGEVWLANLKQEMTALEDLSRALYACVSGYYKVQQKDGADLAAQATQQFWQLCEREFQNLVASCDADESSLVVRRRLRSRFASYLYQVYDRSCPRDTARQMDAWAQCRPNTYRYLKQETQTA